MIKVTMNLLALQTWFDGDLAAVMDLVKLADQAGVDQINLGDHVVIGEDVANYPYGDFAAPFDFPWNEPLIMLAAAASITTRARLSTGVLISPLRPAVLLAKQIATLDRLSRGRVDVGLGVGWHRPEYAASGVPFAERLPRLEEQVQACKALWRDLPASYAGKYVNFERVYCVPQPAQKNGPPLWFGLALNDRNLATIVAHGDGWLPFGLNLEQTRTGVDRLRAAFTAAGRDPESLTVRHLLVPEFRADGLADIDKALELVPAWRKAGATMIELFPINYCRGPHEFQNFLEQLLSMKRRAG